VLLSRIATGTLGDVFLARREEDGETRVGVDELAVKLIRAELLRDLRFSRLLTTEAPAATRFRHPVAVSVVDVDRDPSETYYVTELQHGQPLSAVLKRAQMANALLEHSMIAWIGAEVASVLGKAHETPWFASSTTGMIHGGISPRSVLVTYDGRVKLLGLGVGRARLSIAPSSARLPYYAPELLLDREASPRSDIYSLGVVMYDAFANRHAFRRATEEETRAAIREARVPPLNPLQLKIDRDAVEVVQRMMAPRVDARFESTAEVERFFRRAAGGAAEANADLLAQKMHAIFAGEIVAEQRLIAAALKRPRRGSTQSLPAEEVQTADDAVKQARPLAEVVASGAPSSPISSDTLVPVSAPGGNWTEEASAMNAVDVDRRPTIMDAPLRSLVPPERIEAIRRKMAAEQSGSTDKDPSTEPRAPTLSAELQEPVLDPSRSEPDLGSRVGRAAPPLDPSRSDPEIATDREEEGAGPSQDSMPTPRDGAPADTLDLAERRRIARYQVQSVLSRSASSLQFRARDPNISRPVVLKVMDPQFVTDPRLRRDDWISLFKREARLAGRLAHPALPILHDAGRDGSVFFIVYSLIEGKPLNVTLESGDQLSREQVRRTLIDLAVALDHLHCRGLVHCDVRASNVIVAASGHAHLVDFSLTSAVEGPEHPLLASNVHTATPDYLAGYGYTPQSDQFALGMLVYQMLTGARPFRGADDKSLIAEIQSKDPRPLQPADPRVGPELAEIVTRMLAKDPSLRFASMSEVVERLGGSTTSWGVPMETGDLTESRTLVERESAAKPPPRERSTDPSIRESDIVIIDDTMDPRWTSEVLAAAGARVSVHTDVASAMEQARRHAPRMVIVARSVAEDPRAVRRAVEQISPDIDLRFVSDAATRLLGPLMSAEEHVLALVAIYERVASLAPGPQDGIDGPQAARAIARSLGAGAKAELIAPLAVAARDLAARLRLSPTSEEVMTLVPGELEPLFQAVDQVLTDPEDVNGPSAPLIAQIVAVVEFYVVASSPRDGRKRLSPKRAVLELRELAGRRVRAEVVEALIDHLREVISALDLSPSDTDAPRILIAGADAIRPLAQALEFDGYAIVEAEDGHVAWEKLKREAYRAAIVDRSLPGRDGLALLRLCRAHPNTEQVAFLILCNGADGTFASEVARAGAAEIMDRTAAVEAIRARVGRLMGAS
jgi:serine/threonine protein kinase/CheY-like chemotaxis protein